MLRILRRPTLSYSNGFVTRQMKTNPSQLSQYERLVVEKLGAVVDPLTKRSLQNLGSIHAIRWGTDNLKIDLDLFIPGHPDSKEVSIKCVC